MTKYRIVFFGTPDLAATILRSLAADPRWNIPLVVSQPDRPRGRSLELLPTPVKESALQLNLPVAQPDKIRDPEFLEHLKSIKPDVAIVAAYGKILPESLLNLPLAGCLNIHTSLLPKYRGAAPIQWAIANGDTETGVTLMKMDAGLDTGPMVASRTTPILPTDTGQTLHDRLATLGADLLQQTLQPYLEGQITPTPQPASGASYARKISRDDGRLDWNLPAVTLWRRLRAFTPWPGAFCFIPDPLRPRLLKIHAAEPVDLSGSPGSILPFPHPEICVACGVGALRILELQIEGGRRLSAPEFLKGHSLQKLE